MLSIQEINCGATRGGNATSDCENAARVLHSFWLPSSTNHNIFPFGSSSSWTLYIIQVCMCCFICFLCLGTQQSKCCVVWRISHQHTSHIWWLSFAFAFAHSLLLANLQNDDRSVCPSSSMVRDGFGEGQGPNSPHCSVWGPFAQCASLYSSSTHSDLGIKINQSQDVVLGAHNVISSQRPCLSWSRGIK